MNSYNEFKQQVSSEKIALAILEASQRLVAFTLHSGSIFKKENFDVAVISSLTDFGEKLNQVSSLESVISNTFYNDRDNRTLYFQLSDNADPVSKFIVLTRKIFLSNLPVILPHDLNEGFEVYFEPQIQSTSSFGVEIDVVNDQTNAIEGSGSLSVYNDNDFWKQNFDKLTFDNQNCFIYSYNRELPANQAKLLFKGKVESKTYGSSKIVFKLKDLISELRNSIQLRNVEELGLRNRPNLNAAKQRMIFGRVEGFRPINLDEFVNSEYPLTGLISWTNGSPIISGSGTLFKRELYPEDKLRLGTTFFTVSRVLSDTSLELTENVTLSNSSNQTSSFSTSLPKRFVNRKWLLAGHALRQPETTIESGTSTSRLVLGSTQDMYSGDTLYVGELGSGQLTIVDEILNDTTLSVSVSLEIIPPQGTKVIKPCIQNVRLNDVLLSFWSDYTVDPETARLTLRETAEARADVVIESVEQITTTASSNVVAGIGTSFKSYLKPGHVIRPKGTVDFFQILSVDSDEQLTLTSNYPVSLSLKNLQYKKFIFDSNIDFLTCTVLGRTTNDLTSGPLIKSAPSVVKKLLEDAGLSLSVNEASFSEAEALIPEEIGFALPQTFNDTKTPILRDVINRINGSVFGILLQDNSFRFSYDLLRPVADSTPVYLEESDILDLRVTSTNKNMIYKSIAEYNFKEYDYTAKDTSVQTSSRISNTARFIQNTLKERTFKSYLVNESDSRRLAQRWSFLLEFSASEIQVETKLQTVDLQINDVVVIDHRKLYTRFGGTTSKKYISVEKVMKSANGVSITGVDLSNAFNRVALISQTLTNHDNSSDDIRIFSGFYTGTGGLINNDEDSFFTNLIY